MHRIIRELEKCWPLFVCRKCKRLNVNVRYSSLRHTPDRTPVRFTFSQMKDEDYEGEQDGVEPLVK